MCKNLGDEKDKSSDLNQFLQQFRFQSGIHIIFKLDLFISYLKMTAIHIEMTKFNFDIKTKEKTKLILENMEKKLKERPRKNDYFCTSIAKVVLQHIQHVSHLWKN